MKIMIFGGAGYVGYELTKRFVSNGDTVAVFDNFSNGDTLARDHITALDHVVVYEQSIDDTTAVQTAIREFAPDVVYNLAALHYIPYCIEHPQQVFQVNYIGLQNIINELRTQPDIKFVYASSASVYGSPDGQCTLDTPTIPNDIYGASKLAGEHLIQFQLENYAMMRLFNVYGNVDPHPHLIPKVARAALNNEHLELGTAVAERDFVHVSDVAEAFFVARVAPKGETYIIASGETHSVRETVDSIYRQAESAGNVTYDTAANMRARDASYLCGDSSKLRQLGWKPQVSFEDGIKSVIDSTRERIDVQGS